MCIFKLVILLVPFFSFGQAISSYTDKEKALMFFKQADIYKQGSIIQLQLYDSALKYNPYNPDVYFEKSIWFKKTGKFTESFKILDKAIEIDPIGYLGYRAWSKLYFLRDFEGALADINSLDVLTPDFTDYPWTENMFYLKGLCYMGLNDFDKAIDNFNISYKNDSDFYSIHYRGVCFYLSGEIEKSLQNFNKSLMLYSKFSDTYYYMAACYQLLGKKLEARKKIHYCNQLFNKGYRFSLPFIEPYKTIYQSDIETLKQEIN